MKTFLSLFFAILLMVNVSGKEAITIKGETVPELVYIVYGGVEDFMEEPKDLIKEYASVFAEKLAEITGSSAIAIPFSAMMSMSTLPDYYIFISEDYDGKAYIEYLASENGGMPPFVPTDSQWDKFSGDESMYFTYVDETSFYIRASDEYALYWAIDDFLNEVKSSDSYVLNVGEKFITVGDYKFPEPTESIGKGKNPYLAVVEKVAVLPQYFEYVDLNDYSDGLQGGGTDGKFAYIGTDGTGDYGRIYKYSLPEWELLQVSDPIVTKHANDISYIEDKNLLTVAHCSDEDVRGFSYVDPKTFEVVDVGTVPVDCWGLEYDDTNEKFIVEADWKHYIFDKEFNLEKEIPYGDQDGTPQSLYIDGEYIYDVRWDMKGLRYSGIDFKDCDFENYIMVHDYENVYIEKMPIPDVTGEPEHIFRYGNMYYIGFLHNVVDGVENPYGVFYEFVLLPESWWAD